MVCLFVCLFVLVVSLFSKWAYFLVSAVLRERERERENFRFMSIFTYAVNRCEQFYYGNVEVSEMS